MDLSSTIKQLGKLTTDNSPWLLTAIGTTGVVTTALLTGKASVRAHKLLLNDLHDRPITATKAMPTRMDQVKVVWTQFIPPVISGTITIAAIIGANQIGSRRTAAIATAYSLSDKAFKEYKDKVVEKFGETKNQKIVDAVAQDHVNTSQPSTEVIIASGEVLCHDNFTGRYFTSTVETIRQAQNLINHQLIHENYASLTDYYNLVKLPSTSYSDDVGWSNSRLLEIEFSTVLSEDNRPCVSVNFSVVPVRDYVLFH